MSLIRPHSLQLLESFTSFLKSFPHHTPLTHSRWLYFLLCGENREHQVENPPVSYLPPTESSTSILTFFVLIPPSRWSVIHPPVHYQAASHFIPSFHLCIFLFSSNGCMWCKVLCVKETLPAPDEVPYEPPPLSSTNKLLKNCPPFLTISSFTPKFFASWLLLPTTHSTIFLSRRPLT